MDLSNEKKDFRNPTEDFQFILRLLRSKRILEIFKFYISDSKFLKLISIHYLKTAIFFKAIMELGLYSRSEHEDIEPKQLELVSEYGESIGLLFQIRDDILDEIGDEILVGKKLHKDRSVGKLTFPSLLGLERTKEIATEIGHYSIELANQFSNFFYKNYFIDLPKYILERKS